MPVMQRLALRPVAITVAAALVFSSCTTGDSADQAETITSNTGTEAPASTSTTTVGSIVLTDVSDLVAAVEGGVVTVTQAQIVLNMLSRPQEVPTGTGTGIVIDDEGHVLTNFHVISGARTVTVVGPEGSMDAAVVGRLDVGNDLALLRVEEPRGLAPLRFGASEELDVGDPVVAIGNALGLGLSVTVGIVSAKGRPVTTSNTTLQDMIQTDAAINSGNSGGPLLNARGEVIGINTAIAGGGAQNIGFAIPIEQATPFIERVIAGAGQPFIGISMLTIDSSIAAQFGFPRASGVVVLEVLGGTPAADAGLQVGDLVVGAGGAEVATTEDFTAAIEAAGVGETLDVDVLRRVRNRIVQLTATVVVGAR